MVDILIAGVAIAVLWWAIKYFPIAAAKSNPERDAAVRRIKWVDAMIYKKEGWPSARRVGYLKTVYGAEYDAYMRSGQQPPIP